MSVKVAVIFPSRGLAFSKTAEELLTNLKGYEHKIFFSHRKPIPECFNEPTERAMEGDYTHLWFVEDDMILPPDTLKKLLEADKAVVTVNYPTTKRGDSSILTVKGRIVYAGTGCTLVKREVMEELRKPYFRTDISWQPKNMGNTIRFRAVKRKRGGYGLHDVTFFIRLFLKDIPVHKLEDSIGQRKLYALGAQGSNNGEHQIEEWHKVKKDRYRTMMKNLPQAKITGMVEVETPEGNMMTTAKHAQKLIKEGLGKRPPKRPITIDTGGLL